MDFQSVYSSCFFGYKTLNKWRVYEGSFAAFWVRNVKECNLSLLYSVFLIATWNCKEMKLAFGLKQTVFDKGVYDITMQFYD